MQDIYLFCASHIWHCIYMPCVCLRHTLIWNVVNKQWKHQQQRQQPLLLAIKKKEIIQNTNPWTNYVVAPTYSRIHYHLPHVLPCLTKPAIRTMVVTYLKLLTWYGFSMNLPLTSSSRKTTPEIHSPSCPNLDPSQRVPCIPRSEELLCLGPDPVDSSPLLHLSNALEARAIRILHPYSCAAPEL